MTTKKGLSGQELKAFRSKVSKLKAKGLVGKRVDARSQKPTRYMREQVAKFNDVLEGRAKVVTAPSRADARRFGAQFDEGRGNMSKGRKVVVPTGSKGSVRVVRAKDGPIIRVRATENGRSLIKEYHALKTDGPGGLPSGKNIKYRIPFGNGSSFTFDNKKDLIEFMYPYETKAKNAFKNWWRYVEIIRVGEEDSEDE